VVFAALTLVLMRDRLALLRRYLSRAPTDPAD